MEIKVTKVNDEPGFDANGKPIVNVRVEFTVGQHGPFIERFPKLTFSSADANNKLRAFAAQLAGLGG